MTEKSSPPIALEQPAQSLEKPLVLVDGTGWGFDTPYYAQYRRGAEIRQMRSHGKGVILGYWRGGVVWLVGASLGDAYANEAHLMAEWLDRYGALGEPGFLCPVGRRCGWGISCMVVKRGCWSVWRLWAGCWWYGWHRVCIRVFGRHRGCVRGVV
jgi:hypothetical protein